MPMVILTGSIRQHAGGLGVVAVEARSVRAAIAALEAAYPALRGWVVENLKHYKTPSCAAALFAELRTVTSSNRTRRYLGEIIDVLARFPHELVEDGFLELAADSRFTPKMKSKFLRAASKAVDTAVDALF